MTTVEVLRIVLNTQLPLINKDCWFGKITAGVVAGGGRGRCLAVINVGKGVIVCLVLQIGLRRGGWEDTGVVGWRRRWGDGWRKKQAVGATVGAIVAAVVFAARSIQCGRASLFGASSPRESNPLSSEECLIHLDNGSLSRRAREELDKPTSFSRWNLDVDNLAKGNKGSLVCKSGEFPESGKSEIRNGKQKL